MPLSNMSLYEEAQQVISFCKKVLNSQTLPRCDYKELLELTIMYLDEGRTLYPIQSPGALHKARWMAKLLYCLKILLLEAKISEELTKGAIFSQGQL